MAYKYKQSLNSLVESKIIQLKSQCDYNYTLTRMNKIKNIDCST